MIGAKRVQPGYMGAVTSGIEEGVVSIKALTNELVAVIYTSGTLKVWSVTSGRCVVD